MVSVYVKALVITLVLFAGNFFFVKYLDDSRAQDLQTRVSELEDEMQSSRTLLLYTQTYNQSSEICPALEETTRAQVNKLYDLFNQLQQTESSSVLSDTSSVKRRFILANSELWLYLQQLNAVCKNAGVKPILYFYPDKRDCVECRAQAQILNQVRDECKNVRIFAFPTDLDMGVVNAIKNRYAVNTTPSIVLNEKTYEGITSKEIILARLSCAKP